MKSSQIRKAGFTLIEILIVIVIISIIAIFGVQMFNSNSVERQVLNKIHNLKASLNHACNQATFENTLYGLHVQKHGYAFSRYLGSTWEQLESEYLPFIEWDNQWEFGLITEGQKVVLNEDIQQVPKLVCFPSGEKTDFELRLSHSGSNSSYQLKTSSLWDIEGRWLNEK